MKIIHSGDWHLGKIVNEFSMLEDQKYILSQLLRLIEDEKPEVFVIAGDLYDRSIPPVEAVELLNITFNSILNELNTPIIVIAGNHDSGQRLSFGSSILNKNGLFIEGIVKEEIKKVVLSDSHGPINFYLIPYVDPREAKVIFKDENLHTHEATMIKIIEKIRGNINLEERNVLVGHGYVSYMKDAYEEAALAGLQTEEAGTRAGLDISDSERPLSIGGTDIISAQIFSDFNYTALGHLHSPQKVGSDKIRYSGSILKYSLSETNKNKSVTIIDIDEKGNTNITLKPLIPMRDMRIIKGPLQELINPKVYTGSNLEDYIYAIITDEGELIDPISKLRAVYPNVMGLARENSIDRENAKTSASSGFKDKSKLHLFEEFYESISGKSITPEKLEVIKRVIEDVERQVI
jgi:exonuclease SbcD